MALRDDIDLEDMSWTELEAEVRKLRDGVRKHRDQKGNNVCYMDAQNYLYTLLPENTSPDWQLLPKEQHLMECERYYDCLAANKPYAPEGFPPIVAAQRTAAIIILAGLAIGGLILAFSLVP